MNTLENATSVLKLFSRQGVSQEHLGLSLSDVVSSLQLPKSTVSRLLMTMETERLLERDPDSRLYRIGKLLLAVSSHYLSTPLVDATSPYMTQLSQCTGYVSILEGRDIMVMRMFPARTYLQAMTPAGSLIFNKHRNEIVGLGLSFSSPSEGKGIPDGIKDGLIAVTRKLLRNSVVMTGEII